MNECGITIDEVISILDPSTTRETIRHIEQEYGPDKVMQFIDDACLSACDYLRELQKMKEIQVRMDDDLK